MQRSLFIPIVFGLFPFCGYADHQSSSEVLAFTRLDSRVPGVAIGDVFAMKLDGTELRRLTTASGASTDSISPDFSPTGDKIVFASHRSNNGDKFTDIYVMDAWDLDGNGQGDSCNRLTYTGSGGFDSSDPAFSPSGDKIAFQRFDKAQSETNIMIMDVDGSNVENLTAGSNTEDLSPTWSPDGGTIAFARDRVLYTVEVLPPHNSNAVLLAPISVLSLHWGSDNRIIVSAIDFVASKRKLYYVDMNMPMPTAMEMTNPVLDGDSLPFVQPNAAHLLFSRTVEVGSATALALENMFVSNGDGSAASAVFVGTTSDLVGSWTTTTSQGSPAPDVGCEYSP